MRLPTKFRQFLDETGGMTLFTGRFFSQEFRPRFEFRELITQCYIIGYNSLPLVGLTGFIMGLVLTMQLRPSLVVYGVQSQLPLMVGVAIVREIGPVITALIFAGKIGSSIGAELGSMKVTEQIDAMEVSGTNPFKYLVVTRVVAATLMLPILVVLSDTISLLGAYVGVNIRSVTSFSLFFRQVFAGLGFGDVLPAVIKTFLFGFAIGMVGCYRGYNSRNGTQWVGRSANSAVVISSILVFIIDLMVVQVTAVRKNLEFPLRRHWFDLSQDKIDGMVREALENVGLAHTVDMMPEELSGGMSKRVALARTLILKPEIILYDEPTTGLDPVTAREISTLIVDIQRKFHTASIVISHDMHCVKLVSDRVALLDGGKCYAAPGGGAGTTIGASDCHGHPAKGKGTVCGGAGSGKFYRHDG